VLVKVVRVGLKAGDLVGEVGEINEPAGIGRLANGFARGFSGDWGLLGEEIVFSGLRGLGLS
jgi:hypothetical protein